MGLRSRRKGVRWELDVARLFRAAGWPDAGRTLNEARDANCGDLEGVKPIAAQLKCGAAPSVWRAIREAREAADPGDFPVAIVKRDRTKPVAVLDLADFMELLSQLKASGTW